MGSLIQRFLDLYRPQNAGSIGGVIAAEPSNELAEDTSVSPQAPYGPVSTAKSKFARVSQPEPLLNQIGIFRSKEA